MHLAYSAAGGVGQRPASKEMEILDGEVPSCYNQNERIAYMYKSVPTGQVLPALSRQG